jgi:hypothetical protein
MIQAIVTLYLSLLPPIDTAHERDVTEPAEVAAACENVFCCELYDTSYTGIGSGRQCHSTNAPGACKYKFTCTTGCYNGAGKINVSTSGSNTGCS